MGIMGSVGGLVGEGMGDLTSMQNNANIQELLDQWKNRYNTLPATSDVNPQAVGQSQLSGVSMDPRYKAAENLALSSLMNEATSGGMTAADKQKLNQAKLAGLGVARGVQGQNEQNLRARGLFGSGAELAGDLSAQQGGVDTAYQGDMATAGAASDRALAALEAAGGFASQLGSQDLTQQDTTAKANDAISQFNAGRQDKADFYDSGLAHQDALDQAKGLDAEASTDIAQNNKWGQQATDKGRGYGQQIGSLGDYASSGSGGGGGGDMSGIMSMMGG